MRKFSFERMEDIIEKAKELARKYPTGQLEVEHIWLSLSMSSDAIFLKYYRKAFRKLKINLKELNNKIYQILEEKTKKNRKFYIKVLENSDIVFSDEVEEILNLGREIAERTNPWQIATPMELFVAIIYHGHNIVCKLFEEEYGYPIWREIGVDTLAKLDYETVERVFKPWNMSSRQESDDDDDEDDFSKFMTSQSKKGSKTPVLDTFGRDLTRAALEGKLDPVIGRDKEIERISQILCRRKKNNPVLVGDPGVGKTSIVEGLAIRIAKGRVPPILQNKRIVMLDLGALVAGTKYRGQFEERIKALLYELEKNRDIIVFIDEIHTVIGAGSASGSLDASNMFKPALTRGELQCIGATTLDDYRQYFEKDPALERRFQKVLVEPTTIEETIQILMNIKSKYEEHHNVVYTPEAIKACVELSEMYITDRYLPDKAIDVLDEAGARTLLKDRKFSKNIDEMMNKLEELKALKQQYVAKQMYEEAARVRDKEKQIQQQIEIEKKRWEEEFKKNPVVVDEDTIAEVVSMMTGIPVTRITATEAQKLANMSDELKKMVIGQDEAVDKVVRAIQRNRAGLRDPNRPIGTFIFLGPTGVGKTHLAKAIALHLFAREDALIRIDMSEYMERFTVSRLIGAPPGYVGYEEGGQLTEAVRKHPYSVVLLDEIEKAHPDIFNILLQILDEGHITDSLGRRINFKNTIIIMTSNVGTRDLKDFGKGIGFGKSISTYSESEEAKFIIEKALKRTFTPEFLNRIDDIIIFNYLKPEDIRRIVELELNKTIERVKKMNVNLQITEKTKEFLCKKGYDEKFGARPLKRAIQKYIEDLVAEEIIKHNVSEATTLIIDVDEEKDTTIIKTEEKAPVSKKK